MRKDLGDVPQDLGDEEAGLVQGTKKGGRSMQGGLSNVETTKRAG